MNKIIIIGIIVIVVIVIGLGANMMAENQNQREYELDQSSIARESNQSDELNYYNQIKKIDANCKCQQGEGICRQPLYTWENTTHYIDNNFCKFIEKPENCTGNILSFINARSNIFNENADSVIWGDTNDSIIEKPGFMECVNQLRNIYGK